MKRFQLLQVPVTSMASILTLPSQPKPQAKQVMPLVIRYEVDSFDKPSLIALQNHIVASLKGQPPIPSPDKMVEAVAEIVRELVPFGELWITFGPCQVTLSTVEQPDTHSGS